jgi:SRSO17 transposase
MSGGGIGSVRPALEAFAAEVFAGFARVDQRATGGLYLRGLLTDGRRKSMQPMAQRLGVDHQRLQQFITSSTWDHTAVRRELAARAVELIGPAAWVVDDTGFPKDGMASPGVARQYSGALGKVANCQVGVSVHAVTDAASAPLNWRLFLPQSWDEQAAPDSEAAALVASRRARAGVPADQRHRPKWELAVQMLDEAAGWGHRPPVLCADAGYGDNAAFRAALTDRAMPYVLQVKASATAYPLDAVPETGEPGGRGRPRRTRYRSAHASLREHALTAGEQACATVTWRAGSKAALTGRFLALQVRPAGRKPRWNPDGTLDAAWLLALWPADQPEPVKYWLSTLPEHTALTDLVRLPRTQDRPRPRPLRRPLLDRLAPPRHPRHRSPPVPHHPAPDHPKSKRGGLTLYKIIRELQTILATWTGHCPTCRQILRV